jgi:Glycerophosphoryl diester phosphodiesterase
MAFAHRGGTEFAPENTYEAFSAAVETGYKYLETDVHPNADEKLMAFHDPTLDRVTNYKGKIRDFSSQELKKIRVNDKFQIPFFGRSIRFFFSKLFFHRHEIK